MENPLVSHCGCSVEGAYFYVAMWEFTTPDRYSDQVCQRGKQEMALETAKFIAARSHLGIDTFAGVGLVPMSSRMFPLAETATTGPLAVVLKL